MSKPCHLELTLLRHDEKCPACGRKAGDHPHWPHNNPSHTNYDRSKNPHRIARSW